MPTSRFAYVAALFCCHATCSVSMVLMNKTISQDFNFPWTVIFLQNIGTVALGYASRALGPLGSSSTALDSPTSQPGHRAATFFGIAVPAKSKNKTWLLAQSCLFMLTLFTSMRALHYVSVPLYVVARNSVPVTVALLEFCVDGTRASTIGVIGMVTTVIGSIVYTVSDDTVEFTGFTYAVAQVLIVGMASAVDKASVRIQSKEEGISPTEVNQIRVALSMPVNIVLIGVLEAESFGYEDASAEYTRALAAMGPTVWCCLAISTIFGFGMGTFNFCLQKEVSATTVQVANILYKLLTTIVSRLTHPSPVAPRCWLGYATSLLGIAVYTFGPKLWITDPAAQPQPAQAPRRPSLGAKEEEPSAKPDLTPDMLTARELLKSPREQQQQRWTPAGSPGREKNA